MPRSPAVSEKKGAKSEKTLNQAKTVLYSAGQTPPPAVLFFSSLQHMLLVISLGMAIPVAIARTVGLTLELSTSLLSAALFSMGLAGILQTIPGRYLGSGYQSLSTADSAALAACILAAEIGGVPLVLGMTLFSSVVRFVLGSFTFRMRKLFPPEVTGTMIFILGLNLVPTGFKYFLGSDMPPGAYNYTHLFVAIATLVFILSCSLFIKKLKPYAALAGIVFGFILSAVTGIFDPGSLKQAANQSLVALPIYKELSFSFDLRVLIPFLVIAIAAVVDNIGDFTACQNLDDPTLEKPDWRSIENGIRGGALGSAAAALIGGPIMSTATTNIGISGASGITSRKVAYLSCGMLIVASFFPAITGTLSLIPTPVLGAVLLYTMCYIMAGGFSSLASRALEDRRIFVIFLSVGFAASTLIPGLYSFLPDSLEQFLVSPMIMGVLILLITTLLSRIGTRKKHAFVTGVNHEDIIAMNEEIENLCQEWAAERKLMRKLQVVLDSLCEGLHEENPAAKLHFVINYDRMQLKLHMHTQDVKLTPAENDREHPHFSALDLSIAMLKNIFDNVNVKWENDGLIIDMDVDL